MISRLKGWFSDLTRTPVWKSVFRHKMPKDPKNRALAVLTNVFLHLHPVRMRKQGLRISLRCLGQLYRDPSEESRARGHIHEHARTDDDRDHSPIDCRNVDRHLDGMAAWQQHFSEWDNVKRRPYNQGADREEPNDERLFSMQLFFEREAKDHRDEVEREK